MRIGQLAELTGLTDRTIRYYERIGILTDPGRTASGYRDYEPDTVDRLRFVRGAQTAGFTLEEIRGVLDLRDGGMAPCSHVETLIADKLREVDVRLAELRDTQSNLLELAGRATSLDPADCHATTICQILDRG